MTRLELTDPKALMKIDEGEKPLTIIVLFIMNRVE